MYTLLHISDLHRSPDDQVSNDELISSLIADKDQYAIGSASITGPNAIVVSGDLVHGSPLGSSEYPQDLEDQYRVAFEFLNELAERFVDGDHSRVIIVPGNHDVDWNVSLQAMVEVGEYPRSLHKLLSRQGTPFRWSWNEGKLFKIDDAEKYSQRFKLYWKLVGEFYRDVDFAHPFVPSRYYNLFELDEGRIVVAAFNSCQDNDCFSGIGEIPYEAISQCHVSLHDFIGNYELKIAVWHHSVEGSPRTADYMDPNTVRLLIHKGFRLGLHGHQHRSDATPYSIHVAGDQEMAVASAGSLCVGSHDLPTGVHRQYNLIEIDDSCVGARIHVREMTLPNIFTAGRLASLGSRSCVDVEWSKAQDEFISGDITATEAHRRTLVLRAEEHLHDNRLDSAAGLLLPFGDKLDAFGKRILGESLVRAKRWSDVQALLREPASLDELTFLVSAHTALGDYETALKDLEYYAEVVSLPDPNKQDLAAFIRAQKEMRT